MISKEEKEAWLYLVVKEPSTLLTGIILKDDSGIYWLNDLYSFRTKNKLELQDEVPENANFCGIVMLKEKKNILEFNQYRKPDSMS